MCVCVSMCVRACERGGGKKIVAERISARHLILEYGLFERMYVCMSVTLRNAIINAYAHAYVHSIDVLYRLLLPGRSSVCLNERDS